MALPYLSELWHCILKRYHLVYSLLLLLLMLDLSLSSLKHTLFLFFIFWHFDLISISQCLRSQGRLDKFKNKPIDLMPSVYKRVCSRKCRKDTSSIQQFFCFSFAIIINKLYFIKCRTKTTCYGSSVYISASAIK